MAYRLIWKEFHELKWSVVATAAIVLAIPLNYVVRGDLGMGLFVLSFTYFVYPVLAGVFFGAQAAAGERANRVAPFVAALPVRPELLGLVRIVASCAAAVLPILLLGAIGSPLLQFAVEDDAPTLTRLWLGCGVCCVATVHLVVFVAVFGTGWATEVMAGLVGFLAFAVWGLVTTIGLAATAEYSPYSSWYGLRYLAWFMQFVGPPFEVLNIVVLNWERMPAMGPLSLGWQPLVWPLPILALAAVFVGRYELAINPEGYRRISLRQFAPRELPTLQRWLPPLLWKSVREIGPISLLVLGIVVLLSLMFGMLQHGRADAVGGSVLALGPLCLIGGFVLALLLGVGVFLPDLQPAVNTFWRSRPISPSVWYWTKYLVGLLALLLTLGLPFVLGALVPGRAFSPFQIGDVLLIVLLWVAVYSLVVAATCLVRHTVHAAVLGIGATGLIYAAVETIAGSGFAPGGPHASPLVLMPVFAVTFVVATLMGWWVAVRDVAVGR